MGPVDSVKVQLAVVLGTTTMPINQLLRMGRGAVIELDATEESDVEILANNVLVARGEVSIQNDKIAVTVNEMLKSIRRRSIPVMSGSGGQPDPDEEASPQMESDAESATEMEFDAIPTETEDTEMVGDDMSVTETADDTQTE